MCSTRTMAVEILVRAKLIKEAYLTTHALVIQRSYRNWRQKALTPPPIRPYKKAIVALQSHYRRRKAVVQVSYFRMLVGTRVKRFAHKVAVLCPDGQGHLTRARDLLPGEKVEALPPSLRRTQLVDIPCMSNAQREELGFAISAIQAMARFHRSVRRIVDIQRVWRTHAVQRSYQRQRQRAIKIQAVWRAKIARNRLRHARASATKIQAHTRRMLTVNAMRRAQEEQLQKAFAAIVDLGEEVVHGVRVRPGGSVSN